LLKELRASGGLAAVRTQQHPDGQAGWWWHLDVAVAEENRRRALRTGLITALVVTAVLAVYFLFRLLFPVDPNLTAAMERETAGETKIQQSGDFAGALADFKAATEFLPNDAETWLRLGAVQQKLGDEAAMDASYQRARSLVVSDADFNLARSQIYLSLAMLDEAKADSESVLAADPKNAFGYYILSSVYEMQGQSQEALKAVQRSAELAEAQQETQLTAMARYRMAILMQQSQQWGAGTAVPTGSPTP
jgi:tetratricopeptide (TPR) repeat protein